MAKAPRQGICHGRAIAVLAPGHRVHFSGEQPGGGL